MNINKMIIAGIAMLAITATTSCRENKFGDVDLSLDNVEKPVAGEYVYDHPCAMWNQADFDRVKASLDNGTAPDPVKQEFEMLKASPYAQKGYKASPLEWIVRGDGNGITADNKEHYAEAMRDAAAAYQLALLWKLTGDKDYAETAIKVCNDWVRVCKGITSRDQNQMLAAGAQGYTFANAGEILRDYEGWSETDFNAFKKWMVDVFASKNYNFMTTHAGTCPDHYWSNWDLVSMCSYLAIGVLTEDDDMVNYIVNYFYTGEGNGCIRKLIQAYHTDELSGERIGQNQESGRDQGHAMMSTAVAANLAQMAYTLYQCNPEIPQLDFFAANDNALMAMGEYVALFNLRNGNDQLNQNGSWILNGKPIPFQEYSYCEDCSCRDKNHGQHHTQAADDNGRGNLRTGWEIYYNHYAKVKGLSEGYKYAKQAADKMRPEGGSGDSRYGSNSGAFDQLGWGTLMMYR